MAINPGGTARQLCAAADEALMEAAFRSGEFAETRRLSAEAREVAARDGNRQCEALALGTLAMTHHYGSVFRLVGGLPVDDGEVAAEDDLMRHALALWEETGDPVGTAMGLFGVSLVFQLRGDWAASMPYLWRSFGLAEAVEESGDLYGCAEIHRHVGFYYLTGEVRPREAVRRLACSLALREKLGDAKRLPSALTALGEAEIAAGNPRRAAGLLQRAVRIAHETGLLPWRIQDAEETLHKAEAALPAPVEG